MHACMRGLRQVRGAPIYIYIYISLSLYILYICIYLYMYVCLSLSLSLYIYIHTHESGASCPEHREDLYASHRTPGPAVSFIVAIFYPFSQFCEINISLLSLQTQPNTAPNLFQRGVEYGKYEFVCLTCVIDALMTALGYSCCCVCQSPLQCCWCLHGRPYPKNPGQACYQCPCISARMHSLSRSPPVPDQS